MTDFMNTLVNQIYSAIKKKDFETLRWHNEVLREIVKYDPVILLHVEVCEVIIVVNEFMENHVKQD